MLTEKVPTYDMVKRSGHFIGYSLPHLNEVFIFYKKHWEIVDGVSNGKYWYYIQEYKDKPSTLAISFHPSDGSPQYK